MTEDTTFCRLLDKVVFLCSLSMWKFLTQHRDPQLKSYWHHDVCFHLHTKTCQSFTVVTFTKLSSPQRKKTFSPPFSTPQSMKRGHTRHAHTLQRQNPSRHRKTCSWKKKVPPQKTRGLFFPKVGERVLLFWRQRRCILHPLAFSGTPSPRPQAHSNPMEMIQTEWYVAERLGRDLKKMKMSHTSRTAIRMKLVGRGKLSRIGDKWPLPWSRVVVSPPPVRFKSFQWECLWGKFRFRNFYPLPLINAPPE